MVLATLSLAILSLKADELTRADSQGNIQASVTLVSPGDLVSLEVKMLAFEVYLNTHSVNLLAYQMEKLSYLRDDSGKKYPALEWEPISESSHHRSGILKFSNLDENGDFIITSSSKSIELVIKGLAGIEERSFRWNIPE